MKNKILLVFLALVLVVSLSAFAACKAEEAPPIVEEEEEEAPPVVEEEEEEVWEWPDTMIISGFGAGGGAWAIALGTELEKATEMKVRIIPEDSWAIRLSRLKDGFSDLSYREHIVLYRDDIEAVKETATRYLGPFQVRFLWSNLCLYLPFAVRGDSYIETIYDMKPGVRMGHYIGNPLVEQVMRALAAWAGLDPEEDIVLVPFGTGDACTRALGAGKVDVIITGPTSEVLMEVSLGPHGVRCLETPYDTDPEGLARFEAVVTWPFSTYPAGIGGLQQFVDKRMISFSTILITRAEIDPELIYQVAKFIDTHYDELVAAYQQNDAMHINAFRSLLDTNPVPVHEGVIRYLREVGMWTADDDARQEYNVQLLTRYVDAFQEAVDMADAQGIEIHPDNEEWMELWENYKKELNLPHVRPYVEVPS